MEWDKLSESAVAVAISFLRMASVLLHVMILNMVHFQGPHRWPQPTPTWLDKTNDIHVVHDPSWPIMTHHDPSWPIMTHHDPISGHGISRVVDISSKKERPGCWDHLGSAERTLCSLVFSEAHYCQDFFPLFVSFCFVRIAPQPPQMV